jgi:hypothetical protein
MKEKIRTLLKKVLGVKEIPGDPIDLTPGIKVSRVVDVTGRTLTFNEISENILRQREALQK